MAVPESRQPSTTLVLPVISTILFRVRGPLYHGLLFQHILCVPSSVANLHGCQVFICNNYEQQLFINALRHPYASSVAFKCFHGCKSGHSLLVSQQRQEGLGQPASQTEARAEPIHSPGRVFLILVCTNEYLDVYYVTAGNPTLSNIHLEMQAAATP